MALSKNAKAARKLFRETYGQTTAAVVQQIARGRESDIIADKVGITVASVAATRANLTRGVYAPYAVGTSMNVSGSCDF